MIKATRFVRDDGMEMADPYNSNVWHVKCLVGQRAAFFSFKNNKWVRSSSIDFSSFSDYETHYDSARRILELAKFPTQEVIGPVRKI